jgi:hypothetical protein
VVVVPVPVAPQAGADVPTAAAFSWTGRLSAGQAYMVHLIHVGTHWTLTSPPLGTTGWTVELPAERYGEWHWQVRVVSGGATVAESASIHFYLVPLPGHAGPGATATPLPYPYPTSPYPTPTPYPYPYPYP